MSTSDDSEEIELERLAVERARLNLEADRIAFEASHSFAKDGIKHLILINGGAVIAILAFLGHERTSASVGSEPRTLALAMILFGAGVAAGGACALLAYIFQTVEREGQEWVRARRSLRYSALAMAVLGLGFFLSGLLVAAYNFAYT